MSAEVAVPPNPQYRRRPADASVIDVDEYDDDVQFMGMVHRRPAFEPRRQRFGEIIEIIQDDDRRAAGHPRHIPVQRRQIFSPPPPIQHHVVPPVPRLPRHLEPYVSQPRLPPMHRYPPAHPEPPGLIRPRADPFEWERFLAHDPPRPRTPAAAPAPRLPRIELGGGGLVPGHAPAPAPAPLGFGYGAEAMRRIFQLERPRAWFAELFGLSRADDGDEEAEALAQLYGPDGDPDAAAAFLPWQERVRYVRHGPIERERAPEYRPEYTHPAQPEPGFAYDFAPEPPVKGESPSDPMIIDDEVDATPAPALELACAHCVRPLELGGTGATDEEMGRKRRVWALRCGHIIDGECLELLMKPLEVPPPVDVKGKGKAKALDDAPSFETIKSGSRRAPRRKRKAGDADHDTADAPVGKRKCKDEDLGPMLVDTPAPDPSNIRSRLRPRPAAAAPAAASSSKPSPASRARTTRPHTVSLAEIAARTETLTTPAAPPSAPRDVRPLPKKPARLSKGKGRGKKPLIEAEHRWACPVLGCAHEHVSQKIDGTWVQKPDQGALAMYV